MATRYYSNTAVETTLASGVTSSATSIQVAATTGFPASMPFTLALDVGAGSEELVSVTAVAGTTLTVTRGFDNTTATAHSAGAVIRHVHSALDFKNSRDHENASVAHGTTGAVVGTTDIQTLTNKTLTSPTITNPTVTESSGWVAYTPTWSAPTAPSIGNGVIEGRYKKVGREVVGTILVVFGSTTTAGTGIYGFSLPVTPLAATGKACVGTGWAVDFSDVPLSKVGSLYPVGSEVRLLHSGGGYLTATTIAWGLDDRIGLQFAYEAAS